MAADVAVVSEIDIGPRPEAVPVVLEEAAGGAVAAGSVIVFADGVPESSTHDVLRSLLLAQLAANARANRFREALKWYKRYDDTLENIGWVVSSANSFTSYHSPTATFTVIDVVNDALARRLTSDEVSLCETTLQRFAGDPQGTAQHVWECPSHSGGIGNFQAAFVTAADETVSMDLVKVHFDGPSHTTQLAVERFASSTRFSTSYTRMTLNQQTFDRLRPAIKTKLEGRYEALVVPI